MARKTKLVSVPAARPSAPTLPAFAPTMRYDDAMVLRRAGKLPRDVLTEKGRVLRSEPPEA
jgi:hypothetical protein